MEFKILFLFALLALAVSAASNPATMNTSSPHGSSGRGSRLVSASTNGSHAHGTFINITPPPTASESPTVVEGPSSSNDDDDNGGNRLLAASCDPSLCPIQWRSDGECDLACNTAGCAYDFGDCGSRNCNSDCLSDWLSDGYCDSACNNVQCGFDWGDCTTTNVEHELCDGTGITEGACWGNYGISCSEVFDAFLEDGYCTMQLNCEAFTYDWGACEGYGYYDDDSGGGYNNNYNDDDDVDDNYVVDYDDDIYTPRAEEGQASDNESDAFVLCSGETLSESKCQRNYGISCFAVIASFNGNGECNNQLNCEALDYDGGDCDGETYSLADDDNNDDPGDDDDAGCSDDDDTDDDCDGGGGSASVLGGIVFFAVSIFVIGLLCRCVKKMQESASPAANVSPAASSCSNGGGGGGGNNSSRSSNNNSSSNDAVERAHRLAEAELRAEAELSNARNLANALERSRKQVVRPVVVSPSYSNHNNNNNNNNNDEDNTCVVCLVSRPKVVLAPCGHACLCVPCSKSPQLGTKCPLCRTLISGKIEM